MFATTPKNFMTKESRVYLSLRSLVILALALPSAALAESVCSSLPADCFDKAPQAVAENIKLRLLDAGPGLSNKSLANQRIGVSCRSSGNNGELVAYYSADLSGTLEFPGVPAQDVTYHLVGQVELDPKTCDRTIDLGEWHQVNDYPASK
jgi:hypothetical protein